MIRILPPSFRTALAIRCQQALAVLKQPVAVGSVVVTMLVMAGQQASLWQSWETVTFDRMMQLRGNRDPDPRLLVVTITEADLKRYSFPISDQTLAQLLAELQRHQPHSVGLDLFRDQPKPPGHDALLSQLAQPNLFAIYKVGSEENPLGIPRPPRVTEDRSGFNDVLTDADGVIRRVWLYGNTETTHLYAFSLVLAQHYLARQGLVPQPSWKDSDRVVWGNAVFTPLRSNSGGYQTIDDLGYQIMLNYRSSERVARQVTLTEVLEQKLDPTWVRDKIVLIGTTAPSARDVFFTPYSSAARQVPTMPGVLIHAQMVSQLLDAVGGDRPLFRFWPLAGELLWVWGWSVLGGAIAWKFRHPLGLSLAGGVGLLAVLGSGFGLFTQAVWVPVVAPAIALILAETGLVAYTAYQIQKEQKQVMLLAHNQEQTITLLRTLLGDPTRAFTDITRPNTVTATPQNTYLPSDLLEVVAPLESSATIPIHPVADQVRTDFVLGNRYRLVKILGTGGFAVTYLAEDIQRPGNPLCVVKHLLPARSDDRFLQTARRLFKTEAEILERLGRHGQIPHLLASFEEKGKFYLVEEYIQGAALSDELASGKPFSEAEALALLADILEVLVFIHSYHVIHRDIKPSNIIRREQDGHLVLIDFGAVKQMHPDLLSQENQTVAIGTRGYAPPEQLVGHPSFSSDLYSLGMVTIQAVTGALPQQLETDPEDGTVRWRHLTDLRPELAAVIEKMVRYYFNERYQTAAEALHDLKHLPNTQVS